MEIAARVGGANIDKMIEYGTDINLWVEWARLELAHLRGATYQLPPVKHEYAGLIVSLARQPWPDTSSYNDPELVWRLNKEHHVGFIFATPDRARIQSLIASYVNRIAVDFTATAPPKTGKRPGG